MNPAYEAGRMAAERVGAGLQRGKDENAIERILSSSMGAGDPRVLQDSIGKILSQVSPERQGVALQYLQSSLQNVQKKQEQQQQMQREQAAGLVPGINPTAQSAIYREGQKGKRLAEADKSFATSGQKGLPTSNPGVGGSERKSKLLNLTGSPDIETRTRAKAELKAIENDEKLAQKRESDVFKSQLGRSEKVLERADTVAEQIPQKRTALNMMKEATASRNFKFFSPDNLAQITGIEQFRSPEGAIFKTAGKEYFLGNIARAGARPNQWIEMQIADMLPQIGRTPEANLSVLRALENELDLDEERVRLTDEISDRLAAEGDAGKGKLGFLINKDLRKYADDKQKSLFNDLRAIKAIGEDKPQKFIKVASGTPISAYMVDALLNMFDNDEEKSMEEAKKLGYSFDE